MPMPKFIENKSMNFHIKTMMQSVSVNLTVQYIFNLPSICLQRSKFYA